MERHRRLAHFCWTSKSFGGGPASTSSVALSRLGGEPDFNPEGLATRSHNEYVEGLESKASILWI
jgi:hypothetical protein